VTEPIAYVVAHPLMVIRFDEFLLTVIVSALDVPLTVSTPPDSDAVVRNRRISSG
jgi:hypothetical protein